MIYLKCPSPCKEKRFRWLAPLSSLWASIIVSFPACILENRGPLLSFLHSSLQICLQNRRSRRRFRPVLQNSGVTGAIVFISVIMVGCCAIFSIHRKIRNRIETNEGPRQAQPFRARALPPPRILEIPHMPRIFTFEELSSATGGFEESNILGEGGFGIVYKGELSRTNETVAIKKLKREARQGEQEFVTEVETISRAHHRHIVSLVGYYIGQDEAREETMMLVYKYIPNDSLYSHLHGEGRETIDWKTRMKIAVGSAKGLKYLHEDCKPKIIHRDIKPDNILLLEDFQPMITDFGLAKLLPDTATHVSAQRFMGTYGYLAPEYVAGGKISEKTDVFAFGVVLLELITGKTPHRSFTDGMVLWARPKLRNALKSQVPNFDELADPSLQKDYNVDEMRRMVSCAARCICRLPKRRPQMSKVLDALEGKIDLKNNNCEELSPPMDSGLKSMFQEMAQKKVDGTSSYQNA